LPRRTLARAFGIRGGSSHCPFFSFFPAGTCKHCHAIFAARAFRVRSELGARVVLLDGRQQRVSGFSSLWARSAWCRVELLLRADNRFRVSVPLWFAALVPGLYCWLQADNRLFGFQFPLLARSAWCRGCTAG
jgi:hypothetical protein